MACIESRCPRARLRPCSLKKATAPKPIRGAAFGKPASQRAGTGSDSGDLREPFSCCGSFGVTARSVQISARVCSVTTDRIVAHNSQKPCSRPELGKRQLTAASGFRFHKLGSNTNPVRRVEFKPGFTFWKIQWTTLKNKLDEYEIDAVSRRTLTRSKPPLF